MNGAHLTNECPFCGHVNEIGNVKETYDHWGNQTGYALVCGDCRAQGPINETVGVAHITWRTRVQIKQAKAIYRPPVAGEGA